MENLNGKTIVITRGMEDFADAAEAVRRLGGVPIACPTIALVPPGDPKPLDDAVSSLREYDWIFFTSPHAVRFFLKRIEQRSISLSAMKGVKTAAVGSATEAVLKEWNIQPAFVASQFTGEHFIREFEQNFPIKGKRFLLPLSSLARTVIVDRLREAGGEAAAVTAYCNIAVSELPIEFLGLMKENRIDWVMFFSSSAVTNFYQILPDEFRSQKRFNVASIGPSTSNTLRELRIEPDVEAQPHTLEGLLEAIAIY